MKVAVVGAGPWGMNHVRTLHAMGSLGAVVETDAKRRSQLETQTPGVPWIESLEALAGLKDISAAVVATPASTHFQVARAILNQGRDVLVEKPLAMSSKETRELVDLANRSKRILMAGHLLLYQPAVRWIRGFLKEGGIGRLASIHQERLNLGRARAAENVLWSLGVHDIAVLVDLVGEKPEKITATGQSVLQKNIEDDFYVHMEFPAGVQAHLHVSWLWPERRRRMALVGDKGMLVYDELEQVVTLHRKRIVGPDLQNEDGGVLEVFRPTGSEPLRLELEHFIACCEKREQPLSGPAHSLEVIEVLEAATSASSRS